MSVMMLDLSKDQGPDPTARMHECISSLARAGDGEARYNLLQFFVTPTGEQLSGKAHTKYPRVLLQQILPDGFLAAEFRGSLAKELLVLKQAPETFDHCPAVRDRNHITRFNVIFNKSGN
jgi:hypothetical protein